MFDAPTFIFQTLQLANIIAAALLVREAAPVVFQPHQIQTPVRTALCFIVARAALVAAIPLLAFWLRLYDGGVNWLQIDQPRDDIKQYARITSLVAMIALYSLQFFLTWEIRYLRYKNPQAATVVLMAVATIGFCLIATGAEWWQS